MAHQLKSSRRGLLHSVVVVYRSNCALLLLLTLQAIRNVVLLFTNPKLSHGYHLPSNVVRNLTALSDKLAYSETILNNITTLSTNYVFTTKGNIEGLLYVPDLPFGDSCNHIAGQYIPANATRKVDLPPNDYILVALVPWINVNCTKAFMAAATVDPLRAMLVYRPDDADGQPPDAHSDLWELDDGGGWKLKNHFPVYAISSGSGARMMQQISLYSGSVSEVPLADQINDTYSPNPGDYVRVWTQLSVSPDPALLAIWAFVLIILAVLLSVIGGTSLLMHYVQNRRRALLRRRVMNGEVNLEALGIKRLTVPLSHIQTYPLFTYNYNPPGDSAPASQPPQPAYKTSSDSDSPSLIQNRGRYGDRLDYQPTCLICLDDFESKVTIIREISCGHIFHPECIDQFLSEMSSLCPLCKESMYPWGHCPKITNSMVRRELNTRKLRSRGTFQVSRWRWLLSRDPTKAQSTQRPSSATAEPLTSIHLQTRSSGQTPSGGGTTRERMQQLVTPIILDETDSDDERSLWKRAALILFPGFS
ncbi:hypothetical protein F4861DRAFT_510940 [Xylaria intraflava]|nr:hypothetical protein F4861DRAFT_510940 [Xylaria intraflava]